MMSYYCLVFLLLLLTPYPSKQPQLPNHVVPLYGNLSLGYYYANIYVGTPTQKQSVIIDTGSGQLALPCSKCTNCGKSHLEPPFQLSESKTSKIITCNSQQQICSRGCPIKKSDSQPCRFSISYAEGSSLSGIIIEDEIQFENDSQGQSIKTAFGCTTKETNLFFTQAANGIFGLAPKIQSKLLQKLYYKHSPITGQDLLFSLCLAKNGGQLVIGKVRPQIHRNNQSIKAKFTTGQNLYTLQKVGQIRLRDRVIKISNQNTGYFGVFIDSGSTFTHFPRQNFRWLSESLQKECSNHPQKCQRSRLESKCFRIKTQQKATIRSTVSQIFSNLEFQINNTFVQWKSTDYFYLRSLEKKEVCLGIQSLDRFILGANWMVNKDIVFNLKQLTVEIFSDAICSNTAIVSSKVEQDAENQLLVYGGPESQQSSLFAGIFNKNNSFFESLLIFFFIIGLFMAILVSIGKHYKNKPIQTSLPGSIGDETAQNFQSSERGMQNQQSSQEIVSENASVVSLEEIAEQSESNP